MSITKYEMPDGGFESHSPPWPLKNMNPGADAAFFAPNALSENAYNHINKLMAKKWSKGTISHQNTEEISIRDSDVIFLKNSEPDEQEFWKEIEVLVHNVNNFHFQFDLASIQTLQLTRYEAPKGHYDWHLDNGLGAADGSVQFQELGLGRKLSFSILINDPSTYSGGDFEIAGNRLPQEEMRKNTAIFFPSIMGHRVTPVTKGVRFSLVGWILGPRLK